MRLNQRTQRQTPTQKMARNQWHDATGLLSSDDSSLPASLLRFVGVEREHRQLHGSRASVNQPTYSSTDRRARESDDDGEEEVATFASRVRVRPVVRCSYANGTSTNVAATVAAGWGPVMAALGLSPTRTTTVASDEAGVDLAFSWGGIHPPLEPLALPPPLPFHGTSPRQQGRGAFCVTYFISQLESISFTGNFEDHG
jgi:hypothetical protein